MGFFYMVDMIINYNSEILLYKLRFGKKSKNAAQEDKQHLGNDAYSICIQVFINSYIPKPHSSSARPQFNVPY